MKREFGIDEPDCLVEDWPGKYDAFSWLEYAVTVPNPTFILTTRKGNGAPNANLWSWGMLTGDRGNYSSLLSLLDHTHSYANILREREWCVNFPTLDQYPHCFRTIHCNGPDNDEITDSGFTVEEAKVVGVPRIAESLISLECRLEWERPLCQVSSWHVFCGRVVHVAIDDICMSPDPVGRVDAMRLFYNVRSTVDPMTGQQYGPNTHGLLRVVKSSVEDGTIEE